MAHMTFSKIYKLSAFLLGTSFIAVAFVPNAYAGFQWVPPTQSAQDPNPIVPVPQVTPMLPEPQPQPEVFMPMEPAQGAPTPTTMNHIVREPIPVAPQMAAPEPAPTPIPSVQMPRYERYSDPYTPNRTENTYSARNQSTYQPVRRVAPAPVAPRPSINPYPSAAGSAPVSARTSDIYAPPQMRQQPATSYAEVVGFGEDVPLALALSQVVPPEYSYSFSPSVNLGKKVSWDGGKPWDAVLYDMIAPLGYGLSIEGNAVKITDRPNSYQTSEIMPAPQDVPQTSYSYEVAVLEAPVAPTQTAPVPTQVYSDSVMASAAPTTIGTPIGGLPGEQSFANIAPAAGEETQVFSAREPVVIMEAPSAPTAITPTDESVANALQALEPVTTPRRQRYSPTAQTGTQPNAPDFNVQAFSKAAQ